MKKFLIILLIIPVLYFAGLLSFYYLPNNQQEKNELVEVSPDFSAELEHVEALLEYAEERNDAYIVVIKELTRKLSEEEMLAFAQSQFVYSLTVNGEPVPADGRISIGPGQADIKLSQRGLGGEFLDPEWHEKGKVTGDYFDHIENFDATGWTDWGADGTVSTARGYTREDSEIKDVYIFTISDELKKRLQMESNEIEIRVEEEHP